MACRMLHAAVSAYQAMGIKSSKKFFEPIFICGVPPSCLALEICEQMLGVNDLRPEVEGYSTDRSASSPG